MQDPHKTAFRMKLETEAPRAYTHAERLHTHVKEPVGYVRVRWIMETSKQSSMHQMCRGLQNVEVGHYSEEEEQQQKLFHITRLSIISGRATGRQITRKRKKSLKLQTWCNLNNNKCNLSF